MKIFIHQRTEEQPTCLGDIFNMMWLEFFREKKQTVAKILKY